jgi:hypothetical protein
MRHNAVQGSIDRVPLGIALSQIARVHREKCPVLRLAGPRFGQDRCGDCVDVAAGLGGLGVWTRLGDLGLVGARAGGFNGSVAVSALLPHRWKGADR